LWFRQARTLAGREARRAGMLAARMRRPCRGPWARSALGDRPGLPAAFRGARCAASEVSPGMHQTPIVDQLWAKRARAVGGDYRPGASSPSKPRTLTPKPPEASAQTIEYAFSDPSNKALVDKYRNPWGHVRPGRLFEDLDALAGTIAFEHCRSGDPQEKLLHIVTASVDRLKYMHRPDLENNLVLTGAVTWVGRSSMEISMRAQDTSWGGEPFMESLFTFVARDPETGRAAQINPLEVSGEEQTSLFELGRKRAEARKAALTQKRKSGLHIEDETHRIAQELLSASQPLVRMPALAPENDVLLAETRMQNVFLTMPQQRNTAGRIFGGFLMRRAYELARSTAHLFGGRRPIFHELDEVTFRAPVSVGDMVKFESCVLYTSEQMDPQGRATIHTEVKAFILRPETREAVISNTFNFTFGVAVNEDGSGGSAMGGEVQLRRVLPENMLEACRIVERYLSDKQQVEEDRAVAAE